MKKDKKAKELKEFSPAECNIGECRRIENEIKEREDKLAGVFQSSPDAIVVIDTHENIIECNKRALVILGYKTEKELIGKNGVSFLARKDRQRARKNIKEAFRKGMLNNIGYTVLSPDGRTIYVLISVSRLRNALGKTLGLMVIVKDITEYKRAEETLRESEIKFRLAFENAHDAIIWADVKTGELIDCNKTAELLFEKPKNQIVGHHQTTLHPPQAKDYCIRMFKRQIYSNTPSVEIPIITKSGKIKIVTIASSLVQIKGRKIIQGVFRDITEHKDI